jgi:hypothetical protein
MKSKLLILIISLFTNIVVSQINATTEEGKKIILKNDKTWEFADEELQNNTTASSVEKPNQNNFRGMAWGDSVSKLKSNYPSVTWEIDTKNDSKTYSTEDYVGGKKALILFMFTDNKLIGGAYWFLVEHSSDNLYYVDFTEISHFLNAKYDMEKSEEWNDTTWKGNDDEIGFAIRNGDVVIREIYQDQNSYISHEISNTEYRSIKHLIIYKSAETLKSQQDSVLDEF